MDYCLVEHREDVWFKGNRTIIFIWNEDRVEYAIDYSVNELLPMIILYTSRHRRIWYKGDTVFCTMIFSELIANTDFDNADDVDSLEDKMLKYTIRVLREMNTIEYNPSIKKAN